MNPLFLEDVDKELEDRIREYADQEGVSLNEAAIRLLRRGAELARNSEEPRSPRNRQLAELEGRYAELIERHYKMTREELLRGETHAFEALVEALRPWLGQQLREFTEYLDVEDVKQEVLLDIFNQAVAVRDLNKDLGGSRAPTASSGQHRRFNPRDGVPFTTWLNRRLKKKAIKVLRASQYRDGIRAAAGDEIDPVARTLFEELSRDLNPLARGDTASQSFKPHKETWRVKTFRITAPQIGTALDSFVGRWSATDETELLASIASLETVDEALWK